MKVSLRWLKELVDHNLSGEELEKLISLHTYPTKGLTNTYLELDLKGYNRPDLLSLRGVATEVAALTKSAPKFLDPNTDSLTDNRSPLNVKVENSDLVPLYCLAKIEGLKVKESESSWGKKLEDSGVRTVNNVADITNLVMLEFGQPMHAFDASVIDNEEIIVRLAKEGEELETLDGKKRALEKTDLLITDPAKPVGIAGVMGGKNSEVTDKTETILLEAAIFDPPSIRKTSTRLGLQSEASRRFQHGLTKKRLLQALSAAIRMYESLGGKLTGLSITGDTKDLIKTINLTHQKVNTLIGVDITERDVEDYLSRLGFKLSKLDGGWEVEVPYFRLDIDLEEDLVEEVARMYGYDKIPANKLEGELPEKIDQDLFTKIYQFKTTLADLGLTEVETYSYHSSAIISNFNWQSFLEHFVKVANPMSAETTYLRQSVWPNLVEVVSKNLRQGFEDIAVFELGKVFTPEDKGVEEFYDLGIALMNGTDNPLAELNQIFETFMEKADIKLEKVEGDPHEEMKDILHPKRFIHLMNNGEEIGGMAELHPRALHQFGIKKRVAILGLQLKKLL